MSTRLELIGALGALLRRLRAASSLDDVLRGSVIDNADRVYRNARKHDIQPLAWTPFRQVPHGAVTEQQVRDTMRGTGYSEAEVRETFRRIQVEESLWVNGTYQVNRREMVDGGVHLSIKRIDQEAVHDWRDLQRIKNELVGPECEAVELYPAVSRTVDTANQYHLFCSPDPTFRFGFGFTERMVTDEQDASHLQRPLAKDTP